MLTVEIITEEKEIFSGQAKFLLAPGVEGVLGILPGHAPLVSLLEAGVVTMDLHEEHRNQPQKSQKGLKLYAMSG